MTTYKCFGYRFRHAQIHTICFAKMGHRNFHISAFRLQVTARETNALNCRSLCDLDVKVSYLFVQKNSPRCAKISCLCHCCLGWELYFNMTIVNSWLLTAHLLTTLWILKSCTGPPVKSNIAWDKLILLSLCSVSQLSGVVRYCRLEGANGKAIRSVLSFDV